MLHRLLLTFSLVILFGLGQIGAVTHEISHYAEASAKSQPQNSNDNAEKSTPKNSSTTHSHTCEKCVGYAELSGAISSSHIALLPVVAETLLSTEQLQRFIASKPLTYSARAPPNLV